MSRPVVARISHKALSHNLNRVKALAPSSKIMSVVKADAYGHGLEQAAFALNMSDAYAVASVEEGIRLREAGVQQPVVLLSGFFSPAELPMLSGYRLSPVVHSLWQVDLLEDNVPSNTLNVWLKHDSGMHRLGFSHRDLITANERLNKIASIEVTGLMTHLANADETGDHATTEQISDFERMASQIRVENYSIANSAGIAGWQNSHQGWVRPGIMLYGSSPLINKTAKELDLKPAMHFASKVVSVSARKAGDRIGYGGDWKCEHDTRIAVVAAGYGDGYPRHAPPGTPVYINGERLPLAGRVSMDLITVDLGNQSDVKPGDDAELWGEHVHVDEVALLSNTIAYELLCHVTRRVPRINMEG